MDFVALGQTQGSSHALLGLPRSCLPFFSGEDVSRGLHRPLVQVLTSSKGQESLSHGGLGPPKTSRRQSPQLP